MPAIFPFTGALLSLQSVQQLSPLRLRIRYTTTPVQTSAYGTTDALNPANYTLGGPGVSAVVLVRAVTGDDMAFDLTCSAPLLTGLWTVSVANVKTASASSLVAPTTLSFTSTYRTSADTGTGVVQQGSYEILRKHLSTAFKGPKWRGLLQAVAASDDINFSNARAAFDQLFVHSASGRYLTERGADRGIERPEGVGLSDEDFRRLIVAVTAEKLTEEAFLEVLEVFYGKDLLHAWVETEVGGPFTLEAGSELHVEIDGTSYTIVFHNAEFAQISSATPTEVAITITRQLKVLGCNGWAEAHVDPLTGDERVRIYSPRMGLSSHVAILGGVSQGALLFPARRLTFNGEPGVQTAQNWAVTQPALGKMKLQLSGASLTDLSTVHAGDYVLVQGANFATANRGSFQITSVDIRYVGATLVQSVEVAVDFTIFLQPTVAIAATTDLLFFHSEVASSSGVVVAHARAGTVDVVLPATTQIVTRREGRAAYLQEPLTVSDVTDLIRAPGGLVTVTTGTAHPLAVGDWITVDGFVSDGVAPTTAPGLPTLPSSPLSLLAVGSPTAIGYCAAASCLLSDGVTIFSNGGLDSVGARLKTSRRWTTTGPVTLANGSRQYVQSSAATADSNDARQYALCSLLPNGRVLRTGGRDGGDAVSGCEIYDPVANTWSVPPSMTDTRVGHFQLLLPNGKVLVGGGDGGTSPSIVSRSSCELFTSDGGGSGTWAATGSMLFARCGATATLLNDGRVLVCGGRPSQGTSYSATNYGIPMWTAEIYDPATGIWTRTGDMGVGRVRHAAVLLPDGRVLVSGGRCCLPGAPGLNFYSTSSEIWDPTTGRWSVLADPHGAAWCNLVLLNGVPHLLNGINSSGIASGNIWYLDLAKMEWKRSIAQNILTVWSDVIPRADGTLFQGGGNTGLAILTSQDLYIPNSNTIVSRGINAAHRITTRTGTTFSFRTDDLGFTHGTSLTVTRHAAPDRAWKGPYLADPFGITIGSPESATTTDLLADASNQSVDLVDASDFPEDGGLVIFNFGYEAQGPIRYLRRLGNTLVLDAGARLPKHVDAGAMATYVISRDGFEPATFDGAFYITGSAQGRIAAEGFLERVRAAGLPMDKTILYPGDRGLAGEGLPAEGTDKLSDKVSIWAGDDVDEDLATAREGV